MTLDSPFSDYVCECHAFWDRSMHVAYHNNHDCDSATPADSADPVD